MQNKFIRIQTIVLFLLILADFIAQVPYYIHLYYNPNNLIAQFRGILIMLVVFAFFLFAFILLSKGKASGYWLMLTFLTVEFLFYLWNTVGEVIHGYRLFFHLANPDLILKIVFAIGYINLFASGYFLGLLLLKKSAFIDTQQESKRSGEYSVR